LDAFFKTQLNPEVFAINANVDTTLFAKDGTKIIIPSTATSQIVGPITVSFREFLKKSDLLLNNLPTITTDERWLESGGSFYFEMSDNAGNRVIPTDDLTINFPISDNILGPGNMSVWEGQTSGNSTSLPVALTNFGLWFPSQRSTLGINLDSGNYSLTWPGFRWINCDYVFESQAPKVKVKATLINDKITSEEILAFIVFKNINAVLRLNQNNRDFESFEIPVGEEANLVMIGLENDFYLKIHPFAVAVDQNFEIEMDKVLEEELIDAVGLLD